MFNSSNNWKYETAHIFGQKIFRNNTMQLQWFATQDPFQKKFTYEKVSDQGPVKVRQNYLSLYFNPWP